MARTDIFTDEEKCWLKENYPRASWEEIFSALPNKTKTQIISKAHNLGIMRSAVNCAKFSKEEDNIIRLYYNQYGAQGVIDNFLPNRTYSSIVGRASKLGVHKQGFWTQEEDSIIIENYYEMPMSELAKLLPTRAKSAIHWRIKQLGLTGAPMYKYTDEEIRFVEDNYQTMSDEELGEKLHRAPASIKEMRRKHEFYRRDPSLPWGYRYLGDFVHRNDAEWKKNSASKCGYKCFITGASFDEIHHLYSRNSIIADVCRKYGISDKWDINIAPQNERDEFLRLYREEAAQYPLGICLAEDVHKKFHNLYGYGNNTVAQFKDFVQSFYPERLCVFNEFIS